MVMRSGFCGTGSHEGTTPKSPSGKPMKVCTGLAWCKCECHTRIDLMFELAGEPRQVMDNPNYVPYSGASLLLPKAERDAILNARTLGEQPTKEGRLKPGHLEVMVQTEIGLWMEEDAEPCTPKYMAERIANKYGIPLPSPGAIHAVLTRWAKRGWVLLAHSPFAFVWITPDGVDEGLLTGERKSLQGSRR